MASNAYYTCDTRVPIRLPTSACLYGDYVGAYLVTQL